MWGVEVAAKNLPTPAAIHSFIHEAFDPDYEKGAIVEYIQENAGLNDMIFITGRITLSSTISRIEMRRQVISMHPNCFFPAQITTFDSMTCLIN